MKIVFGLGLEVFNERDKLSGWELFIIPLRSDHSLTEEVIVLHHFMKRTDSLLMVVIRVYTSEYDISQVFSETRNDHVDGREIPLSEQDIWMLHDSGDIFMIERQTNFLDA